MDKVAFLRGYLACAEWLEDDCIDSAREDCDAFCDANAADLAGLDAEVCGHDFYLTRNRHGAGFWDRGLGIVGERLTASAHAYGSTS